MQLIPDWAPNLHPMIVHFPIALISLAVLLDLGRLFLKKQTWLRPSALALYTFGTLGTLAAYFSGREAADSVDIPSLAFTAVSEHADWGLYTLIFLSLYMVIRLFLIKKPFGTSNAGSLLFFILGAVGFFFVFQTAERGGRLVFEFGMGVSSAALAPEADIPSGFQSGVNGSWSWQASENAARDFLKNYTFPGGESEGLEFTTEEKTLVISAEKEIPVFMLAAGPISDIELIAEVNLDEFNGRFLLVHHFTGRAKYDFFAVDGSSARLGRVEEGELTFMDETDATLRGWTSLKAVGSKGHFRRYVGDKLVSHGHGNELPAGRAGLFFMGSGKIRLRSVQARALSEAPAMMNMPMGGEHKDGNEEKKESDGHGHNH